MSLADLKKLVLRLPESERRAMVSWVYAHELELIGHADESGSIYDGMTPGEVADLDDRVDEIEAGRVELIPAEKVHAELPGYLDELRHQLHHAGQG